MSPPPSALEVPRDHERPTSTASTVVNEDVPSVIDEKVGRDQDNASDKGSETEKASKKDVEAGEEDDGVEYPSGLKMFFIVLALVLSVFLLSLDMVRSRLAMF